MKRILNVVEIFILVGVAIAPLFATFPYRNNIFLSWEGAYRISQGHLPYKDFGMPVGYMYWVVPAAFFKLFGTQMFTLIKAQVLINLLSGFAFRSIFRSLEIHPGIRFVSLLVFSLSYTFVNYWPWYNHTVIVFELIALAFLMKFLLHPGRKYAWLSLSGIFAFISFFTKQDAGTLTFLLCMGILIYNSTVEKNWLPVLIFAGSFLIAGLAMILPFLQYDFGYWFNYGQAPHTSRISAGDIIKEFLSSSQWIKFYLLMISVLLLAGIKNWKEYWQNKKQVIFALLTLGILAEAAIFQVTSYVPLDNNIFFHSFAIAFILYLLSSILPLNLDTWKPIALCTAGVLLWWSQTYWKYVERFLLKSSDNAIETTRYLGYTYADVVNRNTYMIELDTTDIPLHMWKVPKLKSFQKILLPGPTVDGIDRIINMNLVKSKKGLKVLNMTELTPLAREIPFELEKGSHYPLWYHKGVSMFEKETRMFIDRVESKYYDLVLFEYIPYLNNFYPFEVRESLQQHYKLVDAFPAPRKPSSHAWVEVYVR